MPGTGHSGKYTDVRKDMVEGLKSFGLTGKGLKDIMAYRDSPKGRQYLVSCLKRTVFMERLRQLIM